jgi:restriction system protein
MIPKFYELLHPVLLLLAKGDHSRKTASSILIGQYNLSKEAKEEKVSSGTPRFEDRIGWAFTYLTKAEYIELTEHKAVYKITNLGLKSLEHAKENKLKIDTTYLKENSPNYIKNWQISSNKIKADSPTDLEEKTTGFDLEEEIIKANEDFENNLLEKIKKMSWQDFEDLCAVLIEKMGYGIASKRTIRQADGGIDGEIFEDELGLKGKIFIQAKKWDNNKVPPKDMKEFLYNIKGNKGVFITTSDFSPAAKQEAENYKDGKIALINYSELIKLCKKYQILCYKKAIEIYEIEGN